MKGRKLPLLGLTLVTPALGASHALATPTGGALAQRPDPAAQMRLKAELLGIDPEAKLAIAGDRVQLIQLSANTVAVALSTACMTIKTQPPPTAQNCPPRHTAYNIIHTQQCCSGHGLGTQSLQVNKMKPTTIQPQTTATSTTQC